MILKNNNKLNMIIILIALIFIPIYITLAIIDYRLISLAFVPWIVLLFSRSRLFGIIIMIVLNESMFYLTDNFNYNFIILGVIIITLIIVIDRVVIKGKRYPFIFKNSIFMIIILIFFEVFVSFIYTGQSIFMGLDASQRYFRYLLYFYVSMKMNEDNNSDKVVDIIIVIATILAIFYIIQSLIYPSIKIFNMNYMMRNGRVRFYTGISIIIFSLLLVFDRYFENKKNIYLVSALILTLEIYLVGQSRSMIIPLILVVFYKLFNLNNLTNNKILIIFACIFILCIFINIKPKFIDEVFVSVFDEITSNSGTSGVRLREIDFYMNQFFKSPIWGIGIYNDATKQGYEILGRNLGYYQNDIGAIGFISTFGIVGMCIFGTILLRAIKVMKKCKNKYGELVVLYIIFSLPFNFYLENNVSILYILITLSYLESKYIKISNEVDNCT